MTRNIEINKQKVIVLITSFLIFWMGIGATFCYEMGKHGFGNIDWMFVLKNNIPIFIISVTLFLSALNQKNQGNNIN